MRLGVRPGGEGGTGGEEGGLDFLFKELEELDSGGLPWGTVCQVLACLSKDRPDEEGFKAGGLKKFWHTLMCKPYLGLGQGATKTLV